MASRSIIPILICSLCFLFGCLSDWLHRSKKEDPRPTTLPPVTQNGANTFGCLINGEVMVALNRCKDYTCTATPKYDPSLGFLVTGRMDSTDELSISKINIQLDNIHSEGEFSFDTIHNQLGSPFVKCGLVARKYFQNKLSVSTLDSGTYYRGRLHITKWVKGQSGFVSGTFWFDLYNPAQYPDTVRVREGRFDIPFE